MKTKEELNALKEEYEAVGKKLAELTEEELAGITGGVMPIIFASLNSEQKTPERSENCYNFLNARPIE